MCDCNKLKKATLSFQNLVLTANNWQPIQVPMGYACIQLQIWGDGVDLISLSKNDNGTGAVVNWNKGGGNPQPIVFNTFGAGAFEDTLYIRSGTDTNVGLVQTLIPKA